MLELSHVFGLADNIPSSVHYVDEQTFVHLTSANVVIRNVNPKVPLRFLRVTENASVTALAVSSKLIVFSEVQGQKVVTYIHDSHTLKRKGTLNDEESSKPLVSIAISPDSKFIGTLSSEPEYMLLLWHWEKARVIGVSKNTHSTVSGVKIFQLCFNQYDKYVLHMSMVGHNFFRIFKFADNTLKPSNYLKSEHRSNIIHLWVSLERVLVATEEGNILVYENSELKGSLQIKSPQDDLGNKGKLERKSHVTCMRQFSNGFVVGTNRGSLIVMEIQDQSGGADCPYKQAREIKISGDTQVQGLCISSNEETIICTLSDKTIMAVNSFSSDSSFKIECISAAHKRAIVGLDSCLCKPLVITSSASAPEDSSIRVWDYEENTMVYIKTFTSGPTCVSFHPSGLYILTGFIDCVRLIKMMVKELSVYWEEAVSGCRECCFSNGGQFFVYAHEKIVTVRVTWSSQCIGVFTGHTKRVGCLSWSLDDRRIVSVSPTDKLIVWEPRTQNVVAYMKDPNGDIMLDNDTITKNALLKSSLRAVTTNDSSYYYAAEGGILGEANETTIIKEIEIINLMTISGANLGPQKSNLQITQIAMSRSNKFLVIGTTSGHVMMVLLPLAKFNFKPKANISAISEVFSMIKCHNSPVTRIQIAPNDDSIFSTGSDGCLCQIRIKGDQKEVTIVATHAEEVLAIKGEIKNQIHQINELKLKVEEMRLTNERVLAESQANFEEKLRSTQNSFLAAIEKSKAEIEQLVREKADLEASQLISYKEMKITNKEEIDEFMDYYKQKHEHENERQEQLLVEIKQKETAALLELETIKKCLDIELKEASATYSKQLSVKDEEVSQLKNQMAGSYAAFKKRQEEIEEHCDKEIMQIMYRYELRLLEESEGLKVVKAEHAVLQKNQQELIKQIEANKVSRQKIAIDSLRSKDLKRMIETDLAAAKRELEGRKETIEEKEARVMHYRKKNEELYNFRFVLEFKIDELKQQIAPREENIRMHHQTINSMQNEIQQYIHQRNLLLHELKESKRRCAGAERELVKVKEDTEKKRQDYLSVQRDLYDKSLNLKKTTTKLYHKYCCDILTHDDKMSICHKVLRSRDLMEKMTKLSHRKLSSKIEARKQIMHKLHLENAALLTEYNSLK